MGCRMSSKRVPTYRHHKPSGQAVVTLDGRDHYLGKHGTEASKQEYDRLIAEWLASGRRTPRGGDRLDGLTVNELLLAYGYARAPKVETTQPEEGVSEA